MKKFKIRQMRLITLIGCTVFGFASCKQTPNAAMQSSSYETMMVGITDKVLSTSYSATIRGRQDIPLPSVEGRTLTFIRRYRVQLCAFV